MSEHGKERKQEKRLQTFKNCNGSFKHTYLSQLWLAVESRALSIEINCNLPSCLPPKSSEL